METYTLVNDITLLDFLWLSALFVTTLLTFFGGAKRFSWINNLLVGVHVSNWLLYMVYPKPLQARVLATLLVVSVLVIEYVTWRNGKLASERL